MKLTRLLCLLLLLPAGIPAAAKAPIYIWLEPERFEGVEGRFDYWPGPSTYKTTGAWGISGPGISAEWSQGGESEWNSIGAAPQETKATCHRDIVIPRTGRYKIWVRYVDHRDKTEPFRVTLQQSGKNVLSAEMGLQPVVPANDEYELYWGFSFGWGEVEGELGAGPSRILLVIEKPGEGWRQVDAILVTDDLQYIPVAREKPEFAYTKSMFLGPVDGAAWRGSANRISIGAAWTRPPLGGRDFSLWTGIDAKRQWWQQQTLESLSPYDVFFESSPPPDIRDKFHKQYSGRKDLPILSWKNLVPGLYLTDVDLSPGNPIRRWLEATGSPFYILTNYARPQLTSSNGPATYQALTGSLAGQFLGFIHGETVGSPGLAMPNKALAASRRGHIDALMKLLLPKQAELWSEVFKTPVPENFWAKGIPSLSSNSIALCHFFHETGAKVVGYEEDSTIVHVPMRIAFQRGAARQYGDAWINYASGNFGDACNYFYQNPVVPRGAPSWFHSKYSITDGVSAVWYRKLYYLNYLSGASAVFLEQGLNNQWILPGPGTHPIEFSPFGRATSDFMDFVDRLQDRGEPYTPIALLLSYGHGYDPVNFTCKMLDNFREDKADRELRELFNVCWHPSGVLEGQPAAPDVQSMPGGVYGNIFDVLVDRPARARAIMNYPIVWAAGDVDLGAGWQPVLRDYLAGGGTLVLNVNAIKGMPQRLLGVRPTGKTSVFEEWTPDGGQPQPATPFEVADVKLDGAKVLAWASAGVPLVTRQQVAAGAVILTLVPGMLALDERAHPALPYVMNGITQNLLPVEVRLADGERPGGEILYQLNKTKDGYLVLLINNQGIDKTQNGIARVDRKKYVDVLLRTALPVKVAREYTSPRVLQVVKNGAASEIRVHINAGDLQVISLQTRD
jgi:hypothetical protein